MRRPGLQKDVGCADGSVTDPAPAYAVPLPAEEASGEQRGEGSIGRMVGPRLMTKAGLL